MMNPDPAPNARTTLSEKGTKEFLQFFYLLFLYRREVGDAESGVLEIAVTFAQQQAVFPGLLFNGNNQLRCGGDGDNCVGTHIRVADQMVYPFTFLQEGNPLVIAFFDFLMYRGDGL